MEDKFGCSLEWIEAAVDTCAYVKEYCSEHESHFNFNILYYCTFNEELWIMAPIGILLVLLAFYILGTTADCYLSPALETISIKLDISESLAGASFLAFGNGAPDVIAALSASGGEGDGIYLALGALFGGGIFISSIVAAAVILAAKDPIELIPSVFLRDILFYLLGPLIVLGASFIGHLSFTFAIAFLLIYVIFLIIVVAGEKSLQKGKT